MVPNIWTPLYVSFVLALYQSGSCSRSVVIAQIYCWVHSLFSAALILNLSAWPEHRALESSRLAHREDLDPLAFYGWQKAWRSRYGSWRWAKSYSDVRQHYFITDYERITDHFGINSAFKNAQTDCRLHIATD